MRIGILQCDDVRSSLSPEFGEYPEMIESRLAGLDERFTFKTYKAHQGLLPDCVHDCDAYILTGSHYSVFDNEALWINSLQDFVVRLNKAKIKTIGICFGHQLIAGVMGGKVERADCGWLIGVHEVQIQHIQPFMQPLAKQFHIAMMCEDQVQTVSDEATVLASSPKCPYAMLQYDEHMLTIQGHPEFSQAFAKCLLNVRQDEFPSKRYEIGAQSFAEHQLDGELIFNWFAHFLTAGFEPKPQIDQTAEVAQES